MYEIEDIIKKKDWKFLVRNFLPVNFVDAMTFSEVMHLVGNLVKAAEDAMERDNFIIDVFRDFSVNLMIILRAKKSEEWQKDWKNDAFLGIACALVYREEEAFIYLKSAYDRLKDPPQSLIFAYVSAGNRPSRILKREETIELMQEANEKGITYESSERMAMLAQEMGQQKEYKYWKKKARELEEQNIHTAIITPNILKSMFDLQEGYHHEK